MTPFIYTVNIATLAAWLSVAGFGTVGIVVPMAEEALKGEKEDPYRDLESTVMTETYRDTDEASAQESEPETVGESSEPEVPQPPEEALPTPPEIPESAETLPLPEIPDLPPPSPSSMQDEAPKPKPPRPTPRKNDREPTRSTKPNNPAGGTGRGNQDPKGSTGNSGQNGRSVMSDANRLAGGRRPKPAYPAEAKAKGQTGSVVVEFIIGEDGRVVSAYAKRPCPWPILNERAVSAVRRWTFAAGGVSKHTYKIDFQLE